MNEVQKVIRDRRSHRKYTDEPLLPDQISALVEAAKATPTGMNAQAFHFTFVTDVDLIKKVEAAACEYIRQTGDQARIERMKGRNWKIFYDAPLCVFISADPNARWAQIDSGIAVQNLALEAESLGLGSVIIGMIEAAFKADKKEELEKLLRFPDGYEFAIAIGIGHPADEKQPHDLKPDRFSFVG
ncbi:MAG: nitroreductase family protein [Clostridia bacterium]|nr:nitroreductase family protein [Clostridia bacterium]